MKTHPTDDLLPERSARWLGRGLFGAGVLLLGGLLYFLAASRQPPVEMIILPTGSFLMGSPEDDPDRDEDEKLHEVVIRRPFAISRTEITQGQYFDVMGRRPVEERMDLFVEDACSSAGVGDDLPVVCVHWFEALRFCNELSRREGFEPVYEIDVAHAGWNQLADGYRLPTEAEWEYAARAGTRQRWFGTDDEAELCHYNNVADATAKAEYPEWVHPFDCDDGFSALAPVSAKKPNGWSLYGLGGNALEWVWDIYGPYPEGRVVDPSGPPPRRDAYRILRGGNFRGGPGSAGVTERYRERPFFYTGNLGFRVARSLPQLPRLPATLSATRRGGARRPRPPAVFPGSRSRRCSQRGFGHRITALADG